MTSATDLRALLDDVTCVHDCVEDVPIIPEVLSMVREFNASSDRVEAGLLDVHSALVSLTAAGAVVEANLTLLRSRVAAIDDSATEWSANVSRFDASCRTLQVRSAVSGSGSCDAVAAKQSHRCRRLLLLLLLDSGHAGISAAGTPTGAAHGHRSGCCGAEVAPVD